MPQTQQTQQCPGYTLEDVVADLDRAWQALGLDQVDLLSVSHGNDRSTVRPAQAAPGVG